MALEKSQPKVVAANQKSPPVDWESLLASRRRDGLMLDRRVAAAEPLRRHRQGHEEQSDERARDGRGTAEELGI
ncbi:MAG: hypothetical protein ACLQOO_34530 [Terriglobia bacterium]